MQAVIQKLTVFPSKGQPGVEAERVRLLAGQGIEGDRFARGGETQVTAVEAAAAKRVRDAPDLGLCYRKFKANIELEDIRFADLSPGDRLLCGEAVLEVSKRKECFSECVLSAGNGFCPLRQGVLYLKALRSGELQVGQTIKLEKK